MDYLNQILSDDELDQIIDTFDESVLKKLEGENIEKILYYLNLNGIDYSKDILLVYLDLFLLDFDVFVKRFEKLKNHYPNFIVYLPYHMDVLEKMWD